MARGGRPPIGTVAILPQALAQCDCEVAGHPRVDTGADAGGDLVGALGVEGEHGVGRLWCSVAQRLKFVAAPLLPFSGCHDVIADGSMWHRLSIQHGGNLLLPASFWQREEAIAAKEAILRDDVADAPGAARSPSHRAATDHGGKAYQQPQYVHPGDTNRS